MENTNTTPLADYIMRIRRRLPNANRKQPVYRCEKCKDNGVILFIDEDGQEIAKSCECVKVDKARRILESSGISAEFREIGFKEYDTRGIRELEDAKERSIDYLKHFLKIEHNRNNSILLCGQVGAGKTHLGVAISNNLMLQNVEVIYMPYRNVATQLKQRITDEDAYQRELSKYMNARVLFIDDMLKGKITDADVNIMYEIINYRYMNHLPMIVSTEKDLRALVEWDEAIGSRVIEMSREHIVVFAGAHLNYRLRE